MSTRRNVCKYAMNVRHAFFTAWLNSMDVMDFLAVNQWCIVCGVKIKITEWIFEYKHSALRLLAYLLFYNAANSITPAVCTHRALRTDYRYVNTCNLRNYYFVNILILNIGSWLKLMVIYKIFQLRIVQRKCSIDISFFKMLLVFVAIVNVKYVDDTKEQRVHLSLPGVVISYVCVAKT